MRIKRNNVAVVFLSLLFLFGTAGFAKAASPVNERTTVSASDLIIKKQQNFHPDLDFKDISGESAKSHNFIMKFPQGGMSVFIGDRAEKNVGYKLVSGYDPDYWLELKMKELTSRALIFRDIMKGKIPTVQKNQAVFSIDNSVTAKYTLQDKSKVKAEYIVNNPLPDGKLEFSLNYPETDIIPVQNKDGAIEFHKSNGKGKALDFVVFLMEKATAIDASGMEVPIETKLSGKTVTLSLHPPSSAVYPITIDPTTVDATAIALATSYGSQRKFFIDFNGSLIAVYMTTGNDIEMEWSNDAGATWSSTGPVVATTIANVGAAMDSQGNLHVVAEEPAGTITYRKLTVTRSGTAITGASFSSTPVTLDNSAKAHRPTVIVDTGNDLPAVAWSVETTGGTRNTRIRFMRAVTISATPAISDWGDDDASTTGTAAGATYCTISGGQCNDGSSLAISATNAVSIFHPLLLEMPSTGNLILWWTDDDSTALNRVGATRASDATSGKPSYKWTFSTSTIYSETTSLGTDSQGNYFDLIGTRDTQNNRIAFMYSDTANNYTTVKYRTSAMAIGDSSTDISPGSVKYGGGEFSISAGTFNGVSAYALSYINSTGYLSLRTYTTSWSGQAVLDQTSTNKTWPNFLVPAKSHVADQSSTDTSSSSDFGRADSTYVKLAQCFTAGVTGKISQVALNLDKNSAPADGIVVELLNYDTGTSKPGSTVLADGGVAAADLSSSSGWFYVPLNTSYSATSGTKYCLGVRRLATADNTNNYSWYRGTSSTLANADGYYFNGSGWSSAQSWDFAFYSYYESTADADKPKFDLIYTDASDSDVIYHTWHINETYTRTLNATPIALPSDTSDLVVFADQSNYDRMAANDTNYETITGAASSSNYNIFLYKRRNISGTTSDSVTATVVARSSVACSATNAAVNLKIYNYDTTTWDDFDSVQSNNTCTADTDFTFTATKTAAAAYYDSNKWVAVRMYQDAGEGSAYNLTTDSVSFSFFSSGPTKVVFTNAARTLTAGACNGDANVLTIQLQDAGSTPTNPTGTTVINVTSNSPSETVYSDNGCTSATNDFTFTTAQNTKSVYIIDNRKSSPTWTLTATKTSGPDTIADGTQSITINAGSVTRLVVTLPSQSFTDGVGNSGSVINQTAGSSFVITKISATDDYFNVNTGYSGAKTLGYTGPGNAPDTTPPSYTTGVSFTTGQSTTTLTTILYKAETPTITATDGGLYGYASSSLTVDAGTINNYLVTASTPQTAAVCFTGTNTITARDTWNNTRTADASVVNMTTSGTSMTFYTTAGCSGTTTQYTLVSGQVTMYIKTPTEQSGITVTATKDGGSETGTSNTITVNSLANTNKTIRGGIKIKGGTTLGQ